MLILVLSQRRSVCVSARTVFIVIIVVLYDHDCDDDDDDDDVLRLVLPHLHSFALLVAKRMQLQVVVAGCGAWPNLVSTYYPETP